MTGRRLIHLVLFVAILAAMFGAYAPARAGQLSEYEVKAAFLYNFAKFVTWPEEAFSSSKSAITIGILGDDPFGSSLRQVIEGKTVGGRSFQIKHYKRAEEIEGCHILFISSSVKRQDKILADLSRLGILSVGETEHFADKHGVINFVIDQSKVKFEINAAAAQYAGLKVSSKLLRVAKVVGSQGG